MPNDQWASVETAYINLGSLSTSMTLRLSVRDSSSGGPQSSGYQFLVQPVQDGSSALLHLINDVGGITLYSTTRNISNGDVFLIAAQGTTIGIYHNGTLLGSVTDSTSTSGVIWLSEQWSNVNTNMQLTNFLAGNFAATYGISGNAGVAAATVSYTGTASGHVTADGSGNYSITGLAAGSYTVTPSLAGYTFSPTSQNETITSSNITNVNFTASSSGSGGFASTDEYTHPRPVQIFGVISSGANAGKVCAVATDAYGNLAISGGSGGSVNSIDVLGSVADAIPCMIYGNYSGATEPGSTALVAVAVDQYGNILANIGTGGGNTGTPVDKPTSCDTGVTPVQVFGRDPSGFIIGVPASASNGALGDTINPITAVSPGFGGIDELTTESELPVPVILCGRIAPGYANAGAIVACALDSTGALCVSGSSASSATPSAVVTFENGQCAMIQLYGRYVSGALSALISVPLTSAGSLLLN
jgi:hypothetical protein